VSTEPGGGSLVMGEVLRFHVDDSVLADGKVDPDKLRPIGRMGGITYVRTTDRFALSWPKIA
jgi:flavin reductase (DIM6/NTAB) family NADH-FMN oxidoreductase RutF